MARKIGPNGLERGQRVADLVRQVLAALKNVFVQDLLAGFISIKHGLRVSDAQINKLLTHPGGLRIREDFVALLDQAADTLLRRQSARSSGTKRVPKELRDATVHTPLTCVRPTDGVVECQHE